MANTDPLSNGGTYVARASSSQNTSLVRWCVPTGRGRSASPLTNGEEGYSMYIGVGTLVVILIIVLIIYFIRRS
jgi:hypothetical protein